MRWSSLLLMAVLGFGCAAEVGQTEGVAALEAFERWRRDGRPDGEAFDAALEAYRDKLRGDGLASDVVARTIRLVVAHDEATLYDKVYTGTSGFNTEPNQLLVDAVRGLKPGDALDVGMGQGRNALYLAQQGWRVSGFDVSAVGLAHARQLAASLGLTLEATLASDEEFDFGRGRWDLIAIIYAIEKRSIRRVSAALRPGGLVVVEAGRNDDPAAPFGFAANELLKIFAGFDILRYEETEGPYDWGPETIELVRFVARKPQ